MLLFLPNDIFNSLLHSSLDKKTTVIHLNLKWFYAKLISLNQNNISYMSRLHHFNEIIFSINSIASVQFYPIHKILNCYSSWCGYEWEQAFILLNVRSRGKKKLFSNLKYNLFKYNLF